MSVDESIGVLSQRYKNANGNFFFILFRCKKNLQTNFVTRMTNAHFVVQNGNKSELIIDIKNAL